MDSKCNDFATEILSKKYYGPNDKSPDDVFLRVARIAAIPDIIWEYVKHSNIPDELGFSDETIEEINKDIPIEILECFDDPKELELVKLVLRRENIYCARYKEEFDSIKFFNTYNSFVKEYYDAMCNLDFIPASPTLMNAGLGGMLSSCFYLDVEDSLDDIFDKIKSTSRIYKLGGGCGIGLSKLRPEGSEIHSSGGQSSGPLSFLEVFNTTGQVVVQGGRRKAAALGAMRIDHPDIVKFIKAKEVEGKLSNFNLSVLITDEFMKDLKEKPNDAFKTQFDGLVYTTNKDEGWSMISCAFAGCEPVWYTNKDVWDLICKKAWENGEPGIIFHDVLNKDNLFREEFGDMMVNPCSELQLYSGESCNLLELNLINCVLNGSFDYCKLGELVRLGIRFLDNVVSLNKYPLPLIEERTLALRKVGLGTMGLHDVMLKLGIDYGTDKSLELIDKIYSSIKRVAEETSTMLAKKRGIPKLLENKSITRRNIALTTAPPCGSTALIANQVSSGIEPVFQWSYRRKDSLGEHEISHWIVDKYGKVPDYARTALEITPEEHVKVQAQIQKYIDSSISKTVNLPFEATVEDVDKIYKMAYDLGCKSITVYRNGSRKEQVLNVKKEEKVNEVVISNITDEIVNEIKKEWDKPSEIVKIEDKKGIRERPKVLFGATYRINTPAGKILVTINEDDEGIREIIITVNKAGTEIASHVATEGRLISTALKYRVPIDKIIEQLNNQKSSPIWDYISNQSIKSVPDAIAKILEDYLENYEGFSEYIDKSLKSKAHVIEEHNTEKEEISGEICPECGEMLVREGGCISCKSCGYSACGG